MATLKSGVAVERAHARLADVRAATVYGPDGLKLTSDGATMILRALIDQTASLQAGRSGDWILAEGDLEAWCAAPCVIRTAQAAVKLSGHARLSFDPASGLELFSYSAEGMILPQGRLPLAFEPLDAVWFSAGQEPRRGRLPAPPLVAALPVDLAGAVDVPLEPVMLGHDQIPAGVIAEVSADTDFLKSNRFIFKSGAGVVLTDLPPGEIHLRFRSAGPAGEIGVATAATRHAVHATAPRVIWDTPPLAGQGLSGRVEPAPASGWIQIGPDRLTFNNGRFYIDPPRPYGLHLEPLTVHLPGLTSAEPLLWLKDPDRLTLLAPGSDDSASPTIFAPRNSLPLHRAPDVPDVFVDADPLMTGRNHIHLESSRARYVRVDGFAQPLILLADLEKPDILNVSFWRVSEEQVELRVELVDLGVGLDPSATAVIELDNSRRLDVPLARAEDMRYTGVIPEAQLEFKSRRWWVRIRARDMLGNEALYEENLMRRQNNRLLAVTLTDLVKGWIK